MNKERLKSRAKRVKERVKLHLSSFQKEFRKHLSTFLTGSFAFVAALLWRDTIKSFLSYYEEFIKNFMPIKEIWFTQLITAIAVTTVAVIGIVVISKLLKVEE
jgi:hypothetical protein